VVVRLSCLQPRTEYGIGVSRIGSDTMSHKGEYLFLGFSYKYPIG